MKKKRIEKLVFTKKQRIQKVFSMLLSRRTEGFCMPKKKELNVRHVL